MTPAMASGMLPLSVMSRSSGSRRRSTSSRVRSCSPGRARRTTIEPLRRSRSKACSGWPSLQHDVVGHVDGERDGPHPGLGQPPPHPRGRRRTRIHTAHDPGEVAVAAGLALQRRVVGERARRSRRRWARVCRAGRRGRGSRRRAALGVPVLAGDPAHREAVAAVRGHRELDDLVVQAKERDGVVTGPSVAAASGPTYSASRMIPVVVVAEPELVLRRRSSRWRRARRSCAQRRRSRPAGPRQAGRRRRGRRRRSCGRRTRSC